jgi:hypothetical protein
MIEGATSEAGKLDRRLSRGLGELEKKRGDATASWAGVISSREGSGMFPGAARRGFLVGDPTRRTAVLSVGEHLLPK